MDPPLSACKKPRTATQIAKRAEAERRRRAEQPQEKKARQSAKRAEMLKKTERQAAKAMRDQRHLSEPTPQQKDEMQQRRRDRYAKQSPEEKDKTLKLQRDRWHAQLPEKRSEAKERMAARRMVQKCKPPQAPTRSDDEDDNDDDGDDDVPCHPREENGDVESDRPAKIAMAMPGPHAFVTPDRRGRPRSPSCARHCR